MTEHATSSAAVPLFLQGLSSFRTPASTSVRSAWPLAGAQWVAAVISDGLHYLSGVTPSIRSLSADTKGLTSCRFVYCLKYRDKLSVGHR